MYGNTVLFPQQRRRIPPIQCLLTFEALARLRSVTLTADELCVTPSAVSHRVKQLEQILGVRLFGRADFSLTTEGSAYLAHVREGLGALQRFPGQVAAPGRRRLKLAVTPTFARTILIPRLRQFTEAYPEIDLALQVSIPLLDVVAEDADLMGGLARATMPTWSMSNCPRRGHALASPPSGARPLDRPKT